MEGIDERREAIRIIMEAYRQGRINSYIIDSELTGCEDVKEPNTRLLIGVLAEKSGKTWQEVWDAITVAIKPISVGSIMGYRRKLDYKISLEEIAQLVSDNNILLDDNMLEILMRRVWQNDLSQYDLAESVYHENRTRLRELVYDENGKEKIFGEKEEKRYDTIKLLAEAFATKGVGIEDLPMIVFDDPIFLEKYIQCQPINFEYNGQTYEIEGFLIGNEAAYQPAINCVIEADKTGIIDAAKIPERKQEITNWWVAYRKDLCKMGRNINPASAMDFVPEAIRADVDFARRVMEQSTERDGGEIDGRQ